MKKLVKKLLKRLGFDKVLIKNSKQNSYVHSSKAYWEQRYMSNKTSGAGSYGILAEFKAEVLNRFVLEHQIKDVIELGCGDGHQLTLTKFPKYIGYDVSDKAIAMCQSLFKNDLSKQFYSMFDKTHQTKKAQLSLSLDVIYHLVEDDVFQTYMQRLFDASTHYVIIYSSNYDAFLARHVRCRKFTNWIEQYVSNDWELMDYIKNKFPFDASNPNHTSMSDFYIYKKLG